MYIIIRFYYNSLPVVFGLAYLFDISSIIAIHVIYVYIPTGRYLKILRIIKKQLNKHESVYYIRRHIDLFKYNK